LLNVQKYKIYELTCTVRENEAILDVFAANDIRRFLMPTAVASNGIISILLQLLSLISVQSY